MIFGEMNDNGIMNVDVLELIPQRPPFVMIDQLTAFNPVLTMSELTVRTDNIFFCEGRLLATGLIENIAQTCAARIGYLNRQSNKAMRLGFIGAIRNLTVLRTPREGEVLQTSITVKEEVFQMTLVDALVRSGDEVLVKAEMKIALSEIEAHENK